MKEQSERLIDKLMALPPDAWTITYSEQRIHNGGWGGTHHELDAHVTLNGILCTVRSWSRYSGSDAEVFVARNKVKIYAPWDLQKHLVKIYRNQTADLVSQVLNEEK